MIRTLALVLMTAALAPRSGAQDNPLQEALRDADPEGPWHYDDLAAGFAEAQSTGKPLLIVFR